MALRSPDRRNRRRGRQTVERYSSGKRSLGFGAKVAGLSAVAFLGILFSDQIPAAVGTAVRFSNGHTRANAPPSGAYYSGCDEARQAGVAPLYAGEPGYRPEMDGDGDGVACEPYRRR